MVSLIVYFLLKGTPTELILRGSLLLLPLSGAQPLPSAQGATVTTNGDGASYLPVVAEAAGRRQERENAVIRMVYVLITCASLIQAGDYAAAAGNLAEVRSALATTVLTATGIGRVMNHLAAALAQRLFLASPVHSGTALDAASSAEHAGELYRQFYEAGPYLKFAHFTASQAILEAFGGCDRVHIIDLAIMQGVQWPALIRTLSLRPGGPPALRITGVGPAPAADGSRDELHEVGVRLAEVARAVNVPFSFRGVSVDTLEALQPWMFQIVPGEALAVNSICQLHRLLVDRDAASTSPIDTVLGWVAAMQPMMFTVVEQETDHNQPTLVERFINALFYYGAVFDSMGALSSTGGLVAEAYLKREIFDILSGEGGGRAEHHEPLYRWCARLWRAGMCQVPLGASATQQAAALLNASSGAGYRVQERCGSLTLAWHDWPLFTTSVWRTAPAANATVDGIVDERVDNNKSSSGHQQAATGEIAMQ
ncbi:unnamed protein product [Alopecurus aequalis]